MTTLPSEPVPGATDAVVRSFLIADVRGYTRFTRERGDPAAALLAKKFADLARDAVEARGGRVIELRGDEALAVFDAPAQAIHAAIEFQATCAEESQADPMFPLPVGIGIDVGEAIPVEDGYRGVALNMAARLCSNAGAGQVLVTRNVREFARSLDGTVRFLDRGPASFKGFDQAVDVIEAVGDGARASCRTRRWETQGSLRSSTPSRPSSTANTSSGGAAGRGDRSAADGGAGSWCRAQRRSGRRGSPPRSPRTCIARAAPCGTRAPAALRPRSR